MKNLIPLMQREWLQHRFAWALLVLVPLALALVALSVGTIELDASVASQAPPQMALLVGLMSMLITACVLFLLLGVTSVFIAIGTPRRDHADRSVEFWLSLPTGHGESLAAPLLVHLLLVPAAALLTGMAAGLLVSLITVGRLAGLGEWFGLPWGSLLTAMVALTGRVILGLPMAMLWLSPLVLAAMLANAYFKRWGLPVLVTALSLTGAVLQQVFGQPFLSQTLAKIMSGAGRSLMGASGSAFTVTPEHQPDVALSQVPGWAVSDFGHAVQGLASPVLVGALLLSAALFYGLVHWRRRGAGAHG